MTDSKRNESEELSIGTISILRTLVELDEAGAVTLPIDDFVVAQREQGDASRLGDAIEAIRENVSGSVADRPGSDH
jgi:hypothetical protein